MGGVLHEQDRVDEVPAAHRAALGRPGHGRERPQERRRRRQHQGQERPAHDYVVPWWGGNASEERGRGFLIGGQIELTEGGNSILCAFVSLAFCSEGAIMYLSLIKGVTPLLNVKVQYIGPFLGNSASES